MNICRFARYCKHYQKEGFTCNHEYEAKFYCGIYQTHERIKNTSEFKAHTEVKI